MRRQWGKLWLYLWIKKRCISVIKGWRSLGDPRLYALSSVALHIEHSYVPSPVVVVVMPARIGAGDMDGVTFFTPGNKAKIHELFSDYYVKGMLIDAPGI